MSAIVPSNVLAGWNLGNDQEIEEDDLSPPEPNAEMEAKHQTMLTAVGQAAVMAARSGPDEFFFLAYYLSFLLQEAFNLLCELHPSGADDDD